MDGAVEQIDYYDILPINHLLRIAAHLQPIRIKKDLISYEIGSFFEALPGGFDTTQRIIC